MAGDILPGEGRLTIQVPIAQENGGPITGVVRTELMADETGVTCFLSAATIIHPAMKRYR
jgi:hypothetical protein